MVTLASSTIRCVSRVPVSNDPPVEFELDNPTAGDVMTQVVAVNETPTITTNTATDDAFQVLSDNKLLFKIDLPDATTKNIHIDRILANQYPVASPIEVTENSSTFTMSNEYLTVTVRKTQNLGTPLTPVSSIVPATGSVQLTGSDHLAEWSAYHDQYDLYSYEPVLTGYTFEILEQGPLLVRVKATYTFSHSAFLYGSTELIPANVAGTAFASETIELRAGVNAVFFENDSDYPWLSGFTITNLDVNQLRYRGHSASAIAYGYVVVSGTPATYNPDNDTHRNNRTAIKDLTADLTLSDYQYNKFTPVWNPYIANTGRWVIARNTAGTGQYVGIMGGPASRALGTEFSGVKYIGSGTATKIVYACNAQALDGSVYTRFRYPWALTICNEPVPTDESATIPEAGLIHNQQISATLTKLLNWKPASSSETFYTSSLYLSVAQQADLVDRIQTDAAYADTLIAKDNANGGYMAGLLNYIETPTSGEANTLYDEIVTLYESMLNTFWFNNGYNEKLYRYWTGALEMLRMLPRVPFLMQGTELTANQKSTIYKIMLFFGFLMKDEDFVPVTDAGQYNYGNANEPLQYAQQKESLQIILLNNPEISANFDVSTFVADQISRINAYISPYGSSLGSPHYTPTGTEPTLNLVQQAYVAGIADILSESPRLSLFAQFMMDTLTPEDARFGGLRKMIALGDGALEGATLHGQMGTIFYDSNPTLSAKLMDAWDSMGQPHQSFYQSTIFKIDDTLPTASMALADAHYPDYMSVFRSGYGTSNESAVWFLHGDWYSDHRNYDTGATYFYLLGKPIALSWSSIYTPQISSGLMLNGLTRVADISWDGTGGLVPCENAGASDFDITDGGPLFALDSITYTSSSTRPTTQAAFDLDAATTWTRTVMLNKEQVARPVLVIKDEFAGTNAANEKILSLNLMMTGAVVTPGGNVTPSTTANRATSTSKTALSSGWSTFEFEGQWGVNVILMVYNAASANYQLGRFSHTSSPTLEKNQYNTAVGSSYVEMQYQFRLWSTANSIFVLVPWLASGSKPTVTTSGMDVLVNGAVVT